MTKIIDNLLSKGYGSIKYPESLKKHVAKAAEAWQDFYLQPKGHKILLPFEGDGGYEFKDKIADPTVSDHKENFHITMDYEFPASFSPTDVDIKFLKASKLLIENLKPHLRQVAEILSEISGVDFVDLSIKRENSWILRPLYYPPQKFRLLADDHPDKGGHTIPLYQSAPGLQGYYKGRWHSMDHSGDRMLFFLGLLGQFCAKCKLPALSHRVVNSKESRKKGRSALVLFNDYPEVHVVYDKDTYHRTQNLFAPGEHYHMPVGRFTSFFKERTVQDAR